jgi:hypothetical protein
MLLQMTVSGGVPMPEKATIERSRKAKRAGRAATTQAGPFVREEIHHIREGKHGARSTKQAIAIGLAKARRAGVELPPPAAKAKPSTKHSAASADRAARQHTRPSLRRSRAVSRALNKEGAVPTGEDRRPAAFCFCTPSRRTQGCAHQGPELAS